MPINYANMVVRPPPWMKILIILITLQLEVQTSKANNLNMARALASTVSSGLKTYKSCSHCMKWRRPDLTQYLPLPRLNPNQKIWRLRGRTSSTKRSSSLWSWMRWLSKSAILALKTKKQTSSRSLRACSTTAFHPVYACASGIAWGRS